MGNESAAAFFETYRMAFERHDADAIAGHFAYPAHMTSDVGVIELMSIVSRAEWRDEIQRLLNTYQRIGVHFANVQKLTSIGLSPRVLQATVHWMLRDALGADLYDFHAIYTLVEVDGLPRIAAIAHDEILRVQEFRARAGSLTSVSRVFSVP